MAGNGLRVEGGMPIPAPQELVSVPSQKNIGAALVVIGAVGLALTGFYFSRLSLSKQIGLMVGSGAFVVLGLGIWGCHLCTAARPGAVAPPIAAIEEEIAATDTQDQIGNELRSKMVVMVGRALYRVTIKPLDNRGMESDEPEPAVPSSYRALWDALASAVMGSEVVIDVNSTSPRLGKLIYHALLGYQSWNPESSQNKEKMVTCHVTRQGRTIKSLLFRRENLSTPSTAWKRVMEFAKLACHGV